MQTPKITGANPPVNPFTTGLVAGALTVNTTLCVHDRQSVYTATGTAVPADEAHARALAQQAGRWAAFALDRSRMNERTITAKTLEALAYSVLRGARSFALPSKLVGTRDHQRRLWAMVREHASPWSPLGLDPASTDGLVVTFDGDPIGEVQAKHVPWLRPLLPFGAQVYLSRVTGSEREGYRLGCNVVFGHVGQALDALLDALGAPLPPAGYPVGARAGSGDGAPSAATQAVVRGLAELPAPGGDGARSETPALRLVVPAPAVPCLPSETLPEPHDVLLYRAAGRAVVTTEHIARHSQSLEWGYVGAGPADCALSILARVAGMDEAEHHHHDFLHQVVARLPREGGLLRAADIRAWVARQSAPRPAA